MTKGQSKLNNVTTRRDYWRHKNIIKGLGKIMSLLAAIFITLKGWVKNVTTRRDYPRHKI